MTLLRLKQPTALSAGKFFIALSLVLPQALLADESVKTIQNLSEGLVEIRQDIAALHDEINFEKNKYNDQIRALASQKSDLKVKLSRAELNEKELFQELEKLKITNQEQIKPQEEVAKAVTSGINKLKTNIKQSIPFKRKERLEALDEIEMRLATSVITPNKAANQLWAFIEDELMLGSSSGIYNDTLDIDGEPQLVKVLRLGKVAMFYVTQDKQYGMVKRDQETWNRESITSASEKRQLEHLFDSFAKNIRTGQFVLPNFVPQG